jgi:hypothetical protein
MTTSGEAGGAGDGLRVTVAIPSRNRPDSLCRVVGDIWAGRRRPDEVVVICQGEGATATAQRLAREVPGVVPALRFYASARTGASASRNDALRLSSGEFIAFSDDDMSLPETWLESMLDAWKREWDEDAVLLTGPIDAPDGAADPGATPGHRPGEIRREWRTPPASGDVLYGGHFGAPRLVYDRAGSPPFDERFGPGSRFNGAGDEVFALRVLGAGVPVAFEPSIRATHVAHEDEWIRSQFQHSRGAGALLVLRSSWGDRTALGSALRGVGGIGAKGIRAAARLRFREAAGRFAAVAGITHGAWSWWVTGAGNEPRAVEPDQGELRLVHLD